MEKVTKDDKWLGRFLGAQQLDMKKALKMLWDACEWRKTMGCNGKLFLFTIF
jgi:hypothetical protein